MPKIAQLRVIDGAVWARIPIDEHTDVTLWTETEKNAALAAERERCMTAIRRLGQADVIDEAVRDAYETA